MEMRILPFAVLAAAVFVCTSQATAQPMPSPTWMTVSYPQILTHGTTGYCFWSLYGGSSWSGYVTINGYVNGRFVGGSYAYFSDGSASGNFQFGSNQIGNQALTVVFEGNQALQPSSVTVTFDSF
jgi:hypothetical protein